jgi:TonB-linked SusC/RagA family outer membrane protein
MCIRDRGNSSPLLIVDDIPRAFKDLDPNSIETITVLKDAAAVAPYGVAGANGVILVTTKRGKTGAPTLSYNGYVGFQNPTRLTEYPSSYEYASLINAAAANEGLPAMYSDAVLQKFKDGSDPDRYPNTNPWSLINRNTVLTNHNLEISGGNDRVKYYGGIGYQHEKGLFAATYQNRFNLNLTLDAQATKTTKVSLSVKGREQNNHYPSETTSRIFITITNAKPDWTQVYKNGLPGALLAGMIHSDGYRKTNTSQIFSQLSVDQEIPFIPGLKAKGSVAFDPTNTFNKNWLKPVQYWSLDTITNQYNVNNAERPKAELNQSYSRETQLTFQGSLHYNRTFGKNTVGMLGLVESKANDYHVMGALRRNYGLSIDELNMGSSTQSDIQNSGSSSAARQLGFVYRVQYDYDSKYLFEASGRYDGSYYFAPDKRFGFFPAFSVGWRLSEENFIKNNLNWVDNLKLRASYGEVGALAGSAFQYLSTYSVYGPSYVIGGNAVQGIRERAESNPNITWERAQKTDIGLEFTLWKGLLTMEIDYFIARRGNMLAAPTAVVPSEYGIGLSQENAAEMKNHGIDLSASTGYRISKDMYLSLGGNLTFAKNSLLKVFETAATYDNPNRRITGLSLIHI